MQLGAEVRRIRTPYSPDLNKIEKFWAHLKHHLRKTLKRFINLWDAVDDAFRTLS